MTRLAAIAGAFWQVCALPFLVLIPALALALEDLLWWLFGKRRIPADRLPSNRCASIVIPNWNGRDLLEKYLPSVIDAAALHHPDNEVIVVDNGSTDGSADFVRAHFPAVRVLALPENRGFGGGSNAGFEAAKNAIVVLLNSDMRVDPYFLQPLLEEFRDPSIFAVSCQILFTDPRKKREESGLTQGWWQDGSLRVGHRIDDAVTRPFPCFYPGGGSSAFDRDKFLELGGFDELYRPFYGEDTDLGYLAWKRGWKVLYQPASLVWHEHRGTIGKTFSPGYIEGTVEKNFVLLCWKNVHSVPRLLSHFLFAFGSALISLAAGRSRERCSVPGLWRASAQLPQAVRSRWRARRLATVADREALRRSLPGYFHDRFGSFTPRPRPRVLMVSPYPIEPPVHGGAVFMNQTARALREHCDLHLAVLVDRESQIAPHRDLETACASAAYLVRPNPRHANLSGLDPHAVHEFDHADIEWLIHRELFLHEIDVLQLEYTNMGQYAGDFRRVVNCVFEHDVYFQSIRRILDQPGAILSKVKPALEYLRALRWELQMLRRADRIQVCTIENGDYLASFDPSLRPKIQPGLRAAIDTSRYPYREQPRVPETMLFLGSFRHKPNLEALQWFAAESLPLILRKRPSARLIVAGAEPPPRHSLPHLGDAIEIRGFVDSVTEALAEPSVFVCPIRSGSGVRVKLLEAFASGVPTVSTRIGAEGLARAPGEFCRLADSAAEFAEQTLDLLARPDTAMTRRARQEVECHWDALANTARLATSYREAVRQKLG